MLFLLERHSCGSLSQPATKPAILNFSLWHHSLVRPGHPRGSRLRHSFSLWSHSHYDVICYWAGQAQHYRRTNKRTDTLPHL